MKRTTTTRTQLMVAALAFAALASLAVTATAIAASRPSIDSESATRVTEHDATLEAQITPEGLDTSYYFEIAKSPACLPVPAPFMPCAHVEAGNLPVGTIPANSESQTVSLDLASAGMSLEPGATYHYRVVATNTAGKTEGQAQTFTTTSKPSIESESASNVTPTNATLEAQIDPGDLETTYEVMLEAPSCQSVNPPGSCEASGGVEIASGTIPAGPSAQTVSVDTAQVWHSLSPRTSYAYFFRASNSDGEAFGAQKEFETPAASSPSIESESVSHVTQTGATLEAQIDPNGLETNYEFWLQYAVCQNPPQGGGVCDAIAVEPRGEGQIAANSAAQTVSTTLTHLQPGYSYTYWVVATNSAGEAEGDHQSFSALPAPAIGSESATGVTGSDAMLKAQINPESLERGVHYQFQVVKNTSEYLPDFACPTEGFPAGTSLCLGLARQAGALPISGSPAGMQDQSVSLDLANAGLTLQPGTIYHYRVIAARIVQTEDTIAWEPPIVYGSDQTFTTPSEPPGPIPLGAQSPGGGVQPSSVLQSPPAASSSHRKHHRRHKRGLHRNSLHRVSHTG